MKIKTILILVELDGGEVHQVLARKDQKEVMLELLRDPKGVLLLSDRVEPVELEKCNTENRENATSREAG